MSIPAHEPPESRLPEPIDRIGERVVVPVVEERLDVGVRVVTTGTVRLERTVREREEVVDLPLERVRVEVERLRIERTLADDETPQPREEGDVLIVPVIEERLVVERRRVLVEEVRVRRVRETVHAPVSVTLRGDVVEVERAAASPGTSAATAPMDPTLAREPR